MPFREESCRSSCIYSGSLHSYSRDAVSQHPSTRAGAESIQLIYSGRALQALSDLAGQFRCNPIFWREFFRVNVLVFPLRQQHKVHKNTSFCTAYLRLHNCLYAMILQSQYFAGSLEIVLMFGSFLNRLLSTSVNKIVLD